jgi:hypothetical protein
MTDPDIVTRLRESDGGYFMRSMFIEAADAIERLRAERDEARRDWCRLWGHTQGRNVAPTQAARLRKWDCFKENT